MLGLVGGGLIAYLLLPRIGWWAYPFCALFGFLIGVLPTERER
jgi:hypothetical protein